MKKLAIALSGALFLCLVMPSCLYKQKTLIHADHSVDLSFDLVLSDYYLQLISDLMLLSGDDMNPFDSPGSFKASLQEWYPRARISSVIFLSPGRYTGSLSFEDVRKEVNLTQDSAFSYAQKGDNNILSLDLSKLLIGVSTNQEAVAEALPNIEEFPTDEAYLDEVADRITQFFAPDDLSSPLQKEDVREELARFRIDLSFSVEGTIVSQEGGTLVSLNEVRYTTPLLPLLKRKFELPPLRITYRLAKKK